MDTYPGTDYVKRICNGADCQELIESLDNVWVDSDEDVCVCTKCKDETLIDYPDAHFRSAREYSSVDLNEVEHS